MVVVKVLGEKEPALAQIAYKINIEQPSGVASDSSSSSSSSSSSDSDSSNSEDGDSGQESLTARKKRKKSDNDAEKHRKATRRNVSFYFGNYLMFVLSKIKFLYKTEIKIHK